MSQDLYARLGLPPKWPARPPPPSQPLFRASQPPPVLPYSVGPPRSATSSQPSESSQVLSVDPGSWVSDSQAVEVPMGSQSLTSQLPPRFGPMAAKDPREAKLDALLATLGAVDAKLGALGGRMSHLEGTVAALVESSNCEDRRRAAAADWDQRHAAALERLSQQMAAEKGEIVRYISGVADGFTVAQRQLADRQSPRRRSSPEIAFTVQLTSPAARPTAPRRVLSPKRPPGTKRRRVVAVSPVLRHATGGSEEDDGW
jgi:hypothetical protein